MRRDAKTEKQKELRSFFKDYFENYNWKKRREAGTFVEVEPYQKGWVRYYILRDDISRRDDAKHIRNALELINYDSVCKREDFTYWNYKTRKYEPISQPLKDINEEQYNGLSEKMKSYFVKYYPVDKWTKKLATYPRYMFGKPDFWFVFNTEPNIITHHWLPDPEFETRRAEIEHKIQSENLWAKVDKVFGRSSQHKEFRLSPYMKSKRGTFLSDDDYGYEEKE